MGAAPDGKARCGGTWGNDQQNAEFTHPGCPFPMAASPGRYTLKAASGARVVVDAAANSVVSWLPWPEGPDLVFHREEPGPGQWPGGSPLLFPAVGRNAAEGRPQGAGFTHGGCTYAAGDKVRPIGVHGFSMHVPWRLAHHAGDTATVEITEEDLGAEQRASYSYSFRVRTEHRLREDGSVHCLTTVQNRGDTPLPFSLGNHMTLRFPFTRDGRYRVARARVIRRAAGLTRVPAPRWADGRVRAPLHERLELDHHSLLSGARTELPECAGEGLPLDKASTCDAVLGGWLSDDRWVELAQRGGPAVRLRQEVAGAEPADVEAATSGMVRRQPQPRFAGHAHRPSPALPQHIVLWGSREDGFFCPEPWVGAPNSLNTGHGRVMLAPGRTFTWQVTASASSPEGA